MENQSGQMPDGRQAVVYVKQIAVSDLPDEVQEQAEGLETLYAVATDEGQHLALVKDRQMAFILARQNDFVPVSVH